MGVKAGKLQMQYPDVIPSRARLVCCCWARAFSPFAIAANPFSPAATEAQSKCGVQSAE